MQKPNDLDETASRANDEKTTEERRSEGAGVPQGGKRRGPGRWVMPEPSRD